MEEAPPEPEPVEEPVAVAEEPAEAPTVHVTPPEPEPEPAPEAPVEAVAEAPAPEPEEAPVEPVPAAGKYRELPGNVDLNTATAQQLMTLEGVTLPLAEKIIAFRTEKGGFKSVFDLMDIPRLGRSSFKQITGMPYSRKHHHRSHRLASLLKMDIADVSKLPAVAEAVSRRPGLQGCLISGGDGLLIAQKGVDKHGEALSAIVPKIARQVQENMELVESGSLDSITICLDGTLYTIVPGENVTLTVVHEKGKVTKSQLSMLKKVTGELAWLLSHRGYVGPAD